MPVLDFFLSEKKINPYFFKNHCYFMSLLPVAGAFQVALVVKNLPANAGDLRDVRDPLGWEDPLEEGMAIHSSILAWRIPWTEEPGRLQSTGLQRVRHDRSDLACTPAAKHNS